MTNINSISGVYEAIKDNKVDHNDAINLKNFVISQKMAEVVSLTQNVDTSLGKTPDLIKGILSGIQNVFESKDIQDVKVYTELLMWLASYIPEKDDRYTEIKAQINTLYQKIDNSPLLDQRNRLQKSLETSLQNLSEFQAKLSKAYLILNLATTDQTKQQALIYTAILFPWAPSEFDKLSDFLKDKMRSTMSDLQKNVSKNKKDLDIFDKEHPSLNNEHKDVQWSDWFKKYIIGKLSSLDTSKVFSSSFKGIKQAKLQEFLGLQKDIIKSIPDDQVVFYVRSLEQKMKELQSNPNLTQGDISNLTSFFSGVLSDVTNFTQEHNIQVPQISMDEYLSKIYSKWLFSQPEYKKAFEEAFDKKDSKLAGKAYLYIKEAQLYTDTTFQNIDFKPVFITVGKVIPAGFENEVAMYPIWTKVLVMQPVDKDGKEEKFTVKDGKLEASSYPTSLIYRPHIVFWEDSVLSLIKWQKFKDSYQKHEGKHYINGQEFFPIKNGKLDLSVFDNRWEKAFSSWLSQQPDAVFSPIENILGSIAEYKNPDQNLQNQYKKSFYTSLVKEIIRRWSSNNQLFASYIDSVSQKIDISLLWPDPVTQKTNYELLNAFITSSNWSKSSDEAQRNIAIKVWSLWLVFQEKTEPQTFQKTIETYAKMLFTHPIGKMLLGLMDTFFWGKGGFKDFIKRKGFDKEGKLSGIIDQQFKDKYSLNEKQLKIIQEDIYGEKSGFEKNPQKMEDIVISFDEYDKDNSSLPMNKLLSVLSRNSDQLDTSLFLRFVKDGKIVLDDPKNKENPKQEFDLSTIFVLDTDWKYILKKDLDTSVLALMLQQQSIKDVVLTTDKKLKSQTPIDDQEGSQEKKKGINYGGDYDSSKKGITSQADYAAFLTAYLIGGNKGDGKFHYVITESDFLPKDRKQPEWVNAQKPIDGKELYNKNKKNIEQEIDDNIRNWKYNETYEINNYIYDSSLAAPQHEYQTKILKPMSGLFLWKNIVDGKPINNFDLLVNDLWSNPYEVSKDNIIHIKNMFTYLKWIAPNNIDLDASISNLDFSNFSNVSKSSDSKKLLLSNKDWELEISVSDDGQKLITKYIKAKQEQQATPQEKKT